MADTTIMVAKTAEAIQMVAESQGLVTTVNPSSVLYVTTFLLAFDLFSDLWLGYQTIGIYNEVKDHPTYYRCLPQDCKVRIGFENETYEYGRQKYVYNSCGDHESEPYCTCKYGWLVGRQSDQVEGCRLSLVGMEEMQKSCLKSNGDDWFFFDWSFFNYNKTEKEMELEKECQDRSFLTGEGEWFKQTSATFKEWPGEVLEELCGCRDTARSRKFTGSHAVEAWVICLCCFVLVGIAITREFIRVALILYNLVRTTPQDHVKFQRWIAESPFLVLFRIFHPTKWQDMSELKVSHQKFLASTGMLINIFTQDLIAIALDIAILLNPIMNGEIRGEELQVYPIVSLVASILILSYNTYIVRKINSEEPNGDQGSRRPSLGRVASTYILNMKQRLLSPKNILLVSNVWAIVDLGFDLAFLSNYFGLVSLAVACRECIQLLFVFRNIFSSSSDVIRPGMVIESALYPVFFYIFKPKLLQQMVQFSVREPAMTRNRILFKLLTQDALCVAMGSYAIHLITNNDDLRLNSSVFEYVLTVGVVAAAVATSSISLVLGGCRLVQLHRLLKQTEPTNSDDEDSDSSALEVAVDIEESKHSTEEGARDPKQNAKSMPLDVTESMRSDPVDDDELAEADQEGSKRHPAASISSKDRPVLPKWKSLPATLPSNEKGQFLVHGMSQGSNSDEDVA